MVGSIAKDTILQFNFDRFFMGLASFNKEQGPTDIILEEVEVKRLMIQRSKRVIALAARCDLLSLRSFAGRFDDCWYDQGASLY